MKIAKIQLQIGELLERIEYLETALKELNIDALNSKENVM
jgi:hypothetical protein